LKVLMDVLNINEYYSAFIETMFFNKMPGK